MTEANISLTLVRTLLIGSMNLGDQLKLALLQRTVVCVIVKYLPVLLSSDKTWNAVLRTGKTMRQRGAHLSKFGSSLFFRANPAGRAGK